MNKLVIPEPLLEDACIRMCRGEARLTIAKDYLASNEDVQALIAACDVPETRWPGEVSRALRFADPDSSEFRSRRYGKLATIEQTAVAKVTEQHLAKSTERLIGRLEQTATERQELADILKAKFMRWAESDSTPDDVGGALSLLQALNTLTDAGLKSELQLHQVLTEMLTTARRAQALKLFHEFSSRHGDTPVDADPLDSVAMALGLDVATVSKWISP